MEGSQVASTEWCGRGDAGKPIIIVGLLLNLDLSAACGIALSASHVAEEGHQRLKRLSGELSQHQVVQQPQIYHVNLDLSLVVKPLHISAWPGEKYTCCAE